MNLVGIISSITNSYGTECLFVEKGFGKPGAVAVKAEVVASGLEVPWGIAFLSGDKMLITERAGRVRKFINGKLLEKPLITISTNHEAESGLLGIAAHPTFEKNRFIYLYYTVKKMEKQ